MEWVARVETAALVAMAVLALLVAAAVEARDGVPTAAAPVATVVRAVLVVAVEADVAGFHTASMCTVPTEWTFLAGRNLTTAVRKVSEASVVWVESQRGKVVSPVFRDRPGRSTSKSFTQNKISKQIQ